ncbi:MAG: type I restriction endonuclease subunit R, partial [Actinomycetota bacterium]|nr:type I restriction endonuclease subunit R [Actinomycetota bacterium]
FWAVRAAVESTVEASTHGDGRAGVVWHTQGSGKSLEMLFYAAKVMRHPAMANPTLVLLTDRNDLDDQLFDEVFCAARTLPETPKQATSRDNLKELLRRASGGIVFTTIQKFSTAAKGERYPLLSDRRNIVVIADEAHRSQYDFIDGFARHLRDGLPNAAFIGFTGTPIEFEDKSTRQVFGEYVSVYDLTQAVEDGATVRIYYEARLAKVGMADEAAELLDKGFDEVTETEETGTKRKAKSRWARIEAIVGAQDRLEHVARDIVEHWEARREVLAGKAMIVCMSRRICAALYDEIAKLRPDWVSDDDSTGKLKVVITGGPMDDDAIKRHVRSKQALREVKARAKDVDDSLELVIVRDMWLTGFDSPSMHTMYVDKPMRGAGLMQAIARINRTFRDKPGGLVVDYLGLADALRKALANYTAQDREEAGIPINDAVRLLQEKHEVVTSILHGHDWSGGVSGQRAKYLRALASTIDFVLADSERKDRFEKQTGMLVKTFALCVPDPRALALRDDVGFFQDVRAQIAKLEAAGDRGAGKSTEELDTAISQLLSEAVASEGVIDLYAAAGINKPDISILSDEFLEDIKRLPQKNLQFELLRKLLNDEIRKVGKRNLVEERRFSDMLQQSIVKYQNRTLSSAEVIAELVALAKEMREARERGERMHLNDAELAFYDAVCQNDSAVLELGDDVLRDIVADLVDTVKRNATVDWSIKEQVRAKLRATVRRVLLRHDYPPDKCEAATNLVLEQAELFASELVAA